MKIFITGGSGFIGTNLVQYYIDKGYEVLNYDIATPQNDDHNKVWVEGDILDYNKFNNEVLNFSPDYFVHLAARTDMLENRDIINGYAENIKGVEITLQIVNKVPSIKRILFASSRMVCEINHVPTDYDDYCPPNYYGLSKVIGERLVKNSNIDKEWVIFRPTSIWGPWFDSPYIIFFNTIKKGLFFKISNQNPHKSFGYVGNSIHQINSLLFANKDDVDQETFYLCDYPPLILNEWAQLINDKLGKSKILTLPIIFLKPLALIGDFLLKLGWNRVPITSFRLDNLITNMTYPTDNLQKVVGDLPYALEESVNNTVNWMKKNKNRDKLAGKKIN